MTHTQSLAKKLGYTSTLVEAGMIGLRSAQSASEHFAPDLLHAARGALKTAAVGAGVALLGSSLHKQRSRCVRAALACGTLTFCADFVWRTRMLSGPIISSAHREVSKVRDRHWLELNPIDYA